MAQFDIHAASPGDRYLLDCQSDLLSHLDTRSVVPLLLPDSLPAPLRRLNPVFSIEGTDYMMVTQYAAAVSRRDLGQVAASLADHDREIMNALDMLLTGV